AQQQRNVVMLSRVGQCEGNGDLRKETLLFGRRMVGSRVEGDPVVTGFQRLRTEAGHPSVLVRGGTRQLVDRFERGRIDCLETDRNAARRPAERRVEHVGGYRAHACSSWGSRSLRSRNSAILRSSVATTADSVSESFSSRSRNAARICSPERPLAQIRKTLPKRSSYAWFPRNSACCVDSSSATPDCSWRDQPASVPVPSERSPIRGCAANALSTSAARNSRAAESAVANNVSTSR